VIHTPRHWRRPRRFDLDLLVLGPEATSLVRAFVAANPRARVLVVAEGDREGAGLAGVARRTGRVRLLDPWTVDLSAADAGGSPAILRAKYLVIATGTEPVLPGLPGLELVPWYTADALPTPAEWPARAVVLGGGATGSRVARELAERGAAVVLLERAARLLPRASEETARGMHTALAAVGVRVCTRAHALGLTATDAGGVIRVQDEHGRHLFPCDALVVALGRRPRLAGLGLEALGLDVRGPLAVDRHLRTRFPHILAVGAAARQAPPLDDATARGLDAAAGAPALPGLGRGLRHSLGHWLWHLVLAARSAARADRDARDGGDA
jgi:pyruvate/2-oxoglutarate dehydrogenase complex dihydrolipoamide dehydrogenase (E3) component